MKLAGLPLVRTLFQLGPGHIPTLFISTSFAIEAEKAGIAPMIEVTVDNGSITVADNGPGIPP
jgi:hypothetical protein